MDIAALSISLNQSRISQQAGLAIFKKVMDSAKVNNDNLIKAMEQSVSPHVGNHLDVKI